MPALGHDGLLTLARRAHAAAADADAQRLADDLGALVRALGDHLRRELPELTPLPPAEVRILRRGQARVAGTARALLDQARSSCAEPPDRCTTRAEELLALLTLQARDERLALDRTGARIRPDGRWR